MIIRRVVLIVALALVQRGKPFRANTRVPEDNRLPDSKVEAESEAGDPTKLFTKDVRVNKVINNDSENDTYFLILLLATAVFSDTSSGNGNVVRTIVYGSIYLFARILYAIAYIFAFQPWRSIFYAIGLFNTLSCSLDLVITMSSRSN